MIAIKKNPGPLCLGGAQKHLIEVALPFEMVVESLLGYCLRRPPKDEERTWEGGGKRCLLGWLEPNNLGLVLLSLLLVTTIATVSGLALGFLLLFCSLTAGTE